MKFSKIIIDSNNLYHRCYYSAKKMLKVYDSSIIKKTIEIFLENIDRLEFKLAGNYCEFYFLWDNSKSKTTIRSQMDENLYVDRKEIDPDYKNNRVVMDDNFYNGIDYLRIILKNRKSTYFDLRIEKFEADDTVKGLIDYFEENDNLYRGIIVSEDLDWSRCITDKMFWYCKNLIWDKELFNHKYKFYPTSDKIIMWKTFTGDKSDNIPVGVKNLSSEIIIRIVNEFPDIFTFLSNYKFLDYISDRMKRKIDGSIKRLRLNYQLVSFVKVNPELVKENLITGKRNYLVLKERYKLSNIDINKFEEPPEFLSNYNENNENNNTPNSFFKNKKVLKRT